MESQGKIYIHGFTIEGRAVDAPGKVKYPANSSTFFITIPAQVVDCTAPVFQNVEVDRGLWTYLVLDNDIITPIYYSVSQAKFYNKNNVEVTTGLVIGQVKVGTIAPAHTQSTIWESIAYDTARTLSAIKEIQTQNALQYLSQATTPEQFAEYAENLGITNTFTTLAAWELFASSLKAVNLTAGTGNGTTGGFRFRAMSREDITQPYDPVTNKSVFDIYDDGKMLFKVDIDTGIIYYGEHFWYDPSTEQISSANGKVIIHADGTLESTDGIYRGTIRAGFNPAETARLAFRDDSGVGVISFAGSALNDLSIIDDGYIKGDFELQIATSDGIEYDIGDTGPAGGTIFIKEINATGIYYGEAWTTDIGPHNWSNSFLTVALSNYGGYDNWGMPVRTDYTAMHPSPVSLNTSRIYWTTEESSPGNRWVGVPTSSSVVFLETGTADTGGYTRPVRFFTVNYDTFKWRYRISDEYDWSGWSSNIPCTTANLTGFNIDIAFVNRFGHANGDTWSFSQGEMYGISGKDKKGNEYFRAENGKVTINNNGDYSLVLQNLPTSISDVPIGGVYNDSGTLKIRIS